MSLLDNPTRRSSAYTRRGSSDRASPRVLALQTVNSYECLLPPRVDNHAPPVSRLQKPPLVGFSTDWRNKLV